ncbi:hypothetical protein M3Y99_00620700 [Aphelenchoides fujianensis]|nr:hypothetical protein M3Y99_00867700 [Aphelenchoides fujianensis]KAI6239165.1 hypothetical protein M3Y99_00620700 [Aphelenchoides fujianensis]
MNSVWIRAFCFLSLVAAVHSLRCKCTQNSNRVPCLDGVCDVETGNSACLTLDHPNSGRHYACSTAPLPEGECVDKTSKSGQVVKVCSCASDDFCNYKLWPDRTSSRYDYELDNDRDVSNGANTRDGHLSGLSIGLAVSILIAIRRILV